MKKTLFLVVLATLLLQAVSAKAQLGFHAGYAPQAFSISANAVPVDMSGSRMHGFFGGVHFSRDFLGGLGFTAAAQIRLNSANVSTEDYITQDWQFLADVPLLLNFGFSVANKLTLGAFAGPMLSYGISYTQKVTDAETFEVVTSTDRYGTSVPDMALKRFETAAVGGVFLRFRSFALFGGYRLGLNDLDRMSESTTKARGFFVGIGIN